VQREPQEWVCGGGEERMILLCARERTEKGMCKWGGCAAYAALCEHTCTPVPHNAAHPHRARDPVLLQANRHHHARRCVKCNEQIERGRSRSGCRLRLHAPRMSLQGGVVEPSNVLDGHVGNKDGPASFGKRIQHMATPTTVDRRRQSAHLSQ